MSTEKKERDFRKFFTPDNIAWWMAELLNPQDDDVILEPSAGNGSLVRAVLEENPKAIVFAFEINEIYRDNLKEAGAKVVVIKDFLETPELAKFSGCIANPPFGNGVDLQAHFDKIRRLVKLDGRIVMIVPFDFDPNCKHTQFDCENWSKNSGGTITEIKIIDFKN